MGYRNQGDPNLLEDPTIVKIAARLGKTPAQITLRWGVQRGACVIPKSTNVGRIRSNFDILQWRLSRADMATLDALDRGFRFVRAPWYNFMGTDSSSSSSSSSSSGTTFRIREATMDDAADISDIYNYYVRSNTATWAHTEEPLAERQEWLAGRDMAELPVLVAEADMEAQTPSRVLGWASANLYSTRDGWRITVEDSIFLHHEALGRGIGRALLEDLLRRIKARGTFSKMVARISADQPASVRLHTSLGFEKTGRLDECGEKFGSLLSCQYMVKKL